MVGDAWRAIRYRRGQALSIAALSALIAACAVVTPLYDRGMQQAVTQLTVAGASEQETAVRVASRSRVELGFVEGFRPTSFDRLRDLVPAGVQAAMLPPTNGTELVVSEVAQSPSSPVGSLLWRDGACDHVVWVTGGCPERAGDVAVSEADADHFGLTVGETQTVVERPSSTADVRPPTLDVRVTGV
jgi:putative ABC transport system permease protein